MAARKAKPMAKMGKKCGAHKMAMGLGIFVFGLVRYLGYSWEIAFMVIGVLAFLYGIFLYSK